MTQTLLDETTDMLAKPTVSLTQAAFDLGNHLFEQAAYEHEIALPSPINAQALVELVKKGVAARYGNGGRGGPRGTVKLLIPPDSWTVKAARELKRQTSPADEQPFVAIGKHLLPLDRELVVEYLEATSNSALQKYEENQQSALTDVRVAEAIKGLTGQAILDKIAELAANTAVSFEDYIASKYSSELIALFGIPKSPTTTE